MAEQMICAYPETSDLDSITARIANDAEKYRMPVKTVSLTSNLHGYTAYYAAIAVFEKMKEEK